VKVELKLLDPRLPGWGFPSRGSRLAAGLDLHACIDAPLVLKASCEPSGIDYIFGLPGTVAPGRRIVPR
jgi:dUTP pyrophosphatase